MLHSTSWSPTLMLSRFASILSNDSLLHSNSSSMDSFVLSGIECLFTRPGSFIYGAFNLIRIFLFLPLCILILHLGLQQRRQQRCTSRAATTSHADSFTYHMVAMELIGVFGYTICCCGIYSDHFYTSLVGWYLYCFTWYGEMFFQLLTCVEHYLAVVQPITYLSLRSERGTRIRNITIGCVWLLCIGATSVMSFGIINIIVDFCILIFSLIVISFCSLCVLYVLIRPGPGDHGGDKERVDQSKQRAFYTVVAILGVLLLRVFWNLFWMVYIPDESIDECMLIRSEVWFNLPSTLVLPLLFLHRAGTLLCCKANTK